MTVLTRATPRSGRAIAIPMFALLKAHSVPITCLFFHLLFKEPASKKLFRWVKPSDSHQFSTDGRRHKTVHHEPVSRDVSRRLRYRFAITRRLDARLGTNSDLQLDGVALANPE